MVPHVEELVPQTDEWETMKEAIIVAIGTALYRRSHPSYANVCSKR
jgi:hypothetical protein